MKPYKMYTSRAEANKAFNHLCGIFEGISIDEKINFQESFELDQWLENHADLGRREPFKELIKHIRSATMDGELDMEEVQDIQWLMGKLRDVHYFEYFDNTTQDLQTLQGLCHGVMSDGKITTEELEGITAWVGDHGHLFGLYPFDELVSVLTAVLEDGVVDEDEQTYLLAFFNDFVNLTDQSMAESIDKRTANSRRAGVCAVDPKIEINGKKIVLTGESNRVNRKDFKDAIIKFGGTLTKSVSGVTDYLIVGAEGNESWAFACYGRKIEAAMNLRRKGKPVVIIHENDFWDWVADNE